MKAFLSVSPWENWSFNTSVISQYGGRAFSPGGGHRRPVGMFALRQLVRSRQRCVPHTSTWRSLRVQPKNGNKNVAVPAWFNPESKFRTAMKLCEEPCKGTPPSSVFLLRKCLCAPQRQMCSPCLKRTNPLILAIGHFTPTDPSSLNLGSHKAFSMPELLPWFFFSPPIDSSCLIMRESSIGRSTEGFVHVSTLSSHTHYVTDGSAVTGVFLTSAALPDVGRGLSPS